MTPEERQQWEGVTAELMSDEETDNETDATQPKKFRVRTITWRAELLTTLISMVDARIDRSKDHRLRFTGPPSEREPSLKVLTKFLAN